MTVHATPVRVLLTGFEPFGGDAHNPSIAAARAAVGLLSTQGVSAHAVELPCVFAAAGPALAAALGEMHPEAVVAVGLAGGTGSVRVERVAVNLQDARIPDNAGDQPVDRPVRLGGPAAHFATLPVKRAVARIRAAGVPAEPSLSAGAFVCNHVMYALLDAPGTARAAGFVHVPWDIEHRPTADAPGLPAADLARAVAETALAALDGGADLTVPGGTLH
ncbi:pyroglutamyl-peptidase I [Micrococcus antarcticus]|uniref:pyroglutamyl-peptidase I family protein n=1 Tax=Micrococcus antarcticus TaxID=86171 RepID=UPI00384E88BF